MRTLRGHPRVRSARGAPARPPSPAATTAVPNECRRSWKRTLRGIGRLERLPGQRGQAGTGAAPPPRSRSTRTAGSGSGSRGRRRARRGAGAAAFTRFGSRFERSRAKRYGPGVASARSRITPLADGEARDLLAVGDGGGDRDVRLEQPLRGRDDVHHLLGRLEPARLLAAGADAGGGAIRLRSIPSRSPADPRLGSLRGSSTSPTTLNARARASTDTEAPTRPSPRQRTTTPRR